MNTIENLKKVTIVLFIILGLAHIISGLMFSNGFFKEINFVLNRSLDIPFAITGIIYGFTELYLNIKKDNKKIIGISLIIILLLIFVFLIYINLFIPDKTYLLEI